MRTKILLFPLLLVIIISIVIWKIVPEWEIVKIKKGDLQMREAQLKEARGKNEIVDKLISTFESNQESRNLIYEYVPTKINDEEIINNLIYYANSQGGDRQLGVSDISIAKAAGAKAKTSSPMDEDFIAMQMSAANSSVGSKMAIGTPLAKPLSFDTKIVFSGRYQGLKEYFAKLAKLKRANNISSFSISRDAADENASPILNIDATMTFSYLAEYAPEKVDGASLEDKLNLDVATLVREQQNAEVMKVEIGSTRRDNPFLP